MIAFVFDTETTGLVHNRTIKDKHLPAIVEFYGCQVDLATTEIKQEVYSLINPQRKMEQEAIDITGISEADIANAPTWAQVAPAIFELIENSPLVIAHNLHFDKEMVDIENERAGLKLNWPETMCTVEQTIHIKGIRLSMMDLHQHLFGERFKEAHRAKNDCMALVRCCCELYAKGYLP